MASGVPLCLITGNGAKGTSFPKQHFFNKFPQQVRLLAAIADVASERVQKFDGGNLAIAGWALATLGMGQHRRGGFVGQSRENRLKPDYGVLPVPAAVAAAAAPAACSLQQPNYRL